MLFVMVSTKISEFYTLKAVESFTLNTRLENHDRFIIIDNDGDLSLPFGLFQCHRNERPQSYAENANFAIRLALSMDTDLMFMNNDIIYSDNWAGPLRESAHILLPSCNQTAEYSHDGLRLRYLMDWEGFGGQSASFNEIARRHCANPIIPDYSADLLMPFYCVLLPQKILRTVGLFDESFGRGGAEDVDYRLRAMRHGFQTLYNNRSYLLHFMGKATWRSGESQNTTAAHDQEYRKAFTTKWGLPLAELLLGGGNKLPLIEKYGILPLIVRQDYAAIVTKLTRTH